MRYFSKRRPETFVWVLIYMPMEIMHPMMLEVLACWADSTEWMQDPPLAMAQGLPWKIQIRDMVLPMVDMDQEVLPPMGIIV